MIEKTTPKLASLFLVVIATGGALKSAEMTASEIDSPAGAGSVQPNLSMGPEGGIYLSWLEPIEPKGYALKFAVRSRGGDWSAPRAITQGEQRFDDSSILALPDGSLAAQWLAKSGPGMHANDVNLSRSHDGGRTWSEPIVPHRDRTPSERGFVSMIPANGGVAVVWLDGRKRTSGDHGGTGRGSTQNAHTGASKHAGQDHAAGQHAGDHHPAGPGGAASEVSLMYTMVGPDGTLGEEVVLDVRVCECCQTAATQTPDGMAIVYRDRSEKEVRDISIVRLRNGQWSKPQPLSKDGWEINGCPVNGPAISSAGQNLTVAWYTAVRDEPRVYAALSTDSGATFGSKILIDDGSPIGRVDITSLHSGEAFVSWVERMPNGAELRARIVRPDGSKAPALVVAQATSGFPKMRISGDEIVIAWSDPQKGRVRTAIVSTADSN